MKKAFVFWLILILIGLFETACLQKKDGAWDCFSLRMKSIKISTTDVVAENVTEDENFDLFFWKAEKQLSSTHFPLKAMEELISASNGGGETNGPFMGRSEFFLVCSPNGESFVLIVEVEGIHPRIHVSAATRLTSETRTPFLVVRTGFGGYLEDDSEIKSIMFALLQNQEKS